MSKLSCEIIKDLIPLYIDDVCSKETAAAIEEHIKECPDCKALLESMKEDLPINGNSNSSSEEEKALIGKIKKTVDRKNNTIKFICIAICAAVIVVGALFILPLKRIPAQSIAIDFNKADITVPDDDMVGVKFEAGGWRDDTIFFYPSDKDFDDCLFTRVALEEYPDKDFAVDEDYISSDMQMSVIKISSNYTIANYRRELIENDGSFNFNLKDARTTVFGKPSSNAKSDITLFEIDDIGQVTIYNN